MIHRRGHRVLVQGIDVCRCHSQASLIPIRRVTTARSQESTIVGRGDLAGFPTGVQNAAVTRQRPAVKSKTVEQRDHGEEFLDMRRRRAHQRTLGADVIPVYQPHELVNNPIKPKDITLELLLASQCHLGHATSLWHPSNQRYIFAIRQGIHILSLDVIAAHLRRACKVVRGVAENGGMILFVGTRKGHARAVIEAAKRTSGYYIFERWIPGSITNRQVILGRGGTMVVDMQDKPIHHNEGEVAALKPDLVVCLNPLENQVMLHECGLNRVPTIGIIDTDCDPTCVTYPIPANDDSLRSVQFIAGVLGRAGEEGKTARHSISKMLEEARDEPIPPEDEALLDEDDVGSYVDARSGIEDDDGYEDIDFPTEEEAEREEEALENEIMRASSRIGRTNQDSNAEPTEEQLKAFGFTDADIERMNKPLDEIDAEYRQQLLEEFEQLEGVEADDEDATDPPNRNS